jgi:hypothetical protein
MKRTSIMVAMGLLALLGSELYAADPTPTPMESAVQPPVIAVNDSLTAEVQTVPVGDYDAREWGVVVKQNGTYELDGSNPYSGNKSHLHFTHGHREPVIYFTSRDKKPFSLKVTIPHGRITAYYPSLTDTSGNSVQWQDVNFFPPQGAAPIFTPNCPSLEKYFSILNNVSSDEFYADSVPSKFLFYESAIDFKEPVIALVNLAALTAKLSNQSDYPVRDLMVTFGRNLRGFRVAKLNLLAAHQERIVHFTYETLAPFPDLTAIGFKRDEATAFDNVWNGNCNCHYNLTYRLSPQACDDLSRLDFTPRPKGLIRAFYVFADTEPAEIGRQSMPK